MEQYIKVETLPLHLHLAAWCLQAALSIGRQQQLRRQQDKLTRFQQKKTQKKPLKSFKF